MSFGVRIRTPCRLHFGMFSFGRADWPQFGGVGMMIDPPAVECKIRPAARFIATGRLGDRVEGFVRATAENWQLAELPPCAIAVDAPDNHLGLGVGTQLGLAVGAGLRRYLGLPPLPVEELAVGVGRGVRSAIGTYGFERGGLIVDAGKRPGQPLGQLAQRAAVSAAWRVVLVRAAGATGLAGEHEARAFDRLQPVPQRVTDELWRITEVEMLPALARSDCNAFGEAVYRFGRLAGECFAAVQGGPFASREIAELVQLIRDCGVSGAGQSSWGPMVFAFTANDDEARALCDRLSNAGVPAARTMIGQPNNQGAQISTL